MRKIFLFFLFTISWHAMFSQGSISGKIIDVQNKQVLAGATVSIRASSNSTVADRDGAFLLRDVSPGKIVVVVSFIGYETLELQVDVVNNVQSVLHVTLKPDTRVGNTVVVTASNHPEKLMHAPASISVIGRKDFEQFAGSNVNEMLSHVNGVQFTRSGIDWITFNARNFNTGGNNKVIQLVDGRLAKAALSLGLPLFSMGSYIKEDLDKLEIVYGPNAALYGPNALNAVFNFISKDPRVYEGTTVSVSAGNHYQFSGRFRQAEKINKKWAYKLLGEYAVGKEYSWIDSVYLSSSPSSKSIPEHNVDLDFRHIRTEGHLYYSLTPKATMIVSGGVGQSNFLQAGRVQLRDVRHGFLQGRIVHPNYFVTVYNTWGNFGKSYLVPNYTRTFYNLTRPPTSMYPDSAEAKALKTVMGKEESQRLNADAQYNYQFRKAGLLLIGSLNYQLERPNGFGITLLDSFNKISITQYGAALQLEKTLPWTLKVIGAARYDHHSNFGDFFSPKLGILKTLGDNSFRVTWGKAYAMPNILSQYANVGNSYFGIGRGITYIPNLSAMSEVPGNYKLLKPIQAESMSTWEFGYKGMLLKNLYLDITYYDNTSHNFISPNKSVFGRALYAGSDTLYPANPGRVVNDTLRDASFSCNFNYGKVRYFGLDFNLQYTINRFAAIGVQYSWFNSDIKDSDLKNDANGDGFVSAEESSLNAPVHKAAISLDLQNLCRNKLSASVFTRLVQQYDFYSGSQIGTAAGEGSRGKVYGGNDPITKLPRYYYKNFDHGPLGGFVSVDVSAGYQLTDFMHLNFGVTNLFDTKQMESVGSPSIGRLIVIEARVHIPKRIDFF